MNRNTNEAKIYLQRIKKIDLCIDHKLRQLEELKTNRINIQATDYAKEKVSCSISNSNFEK